MDLFSAELPLDLMQSARFREVTRSSRDWSELRIARLIELYNDGWSYANIANDLGNTTRNAVAGKVMRLGLPSRTPSRRITATRSRRSRSKGPRQFRPKLQVAELPLETAKPAEFLGLTLMELDHNTCRFPRGDGPNYFFCGQPPKEGSPYCAYCHSIVYTPPSPAQVSRRKERERMQERLNTALRHAP